MIEQELRRSRMYGALWLVVGVVIWVGILAYVVEGLTRAVQEHWKW